MSLLQKNEGESTRGILTVTILPHLRKGIFKLGQLTVVIEKVAPATAAAAASAAVIKTIRIGIVSLVRSSPMSNLESI